MKAKEVTSKRVSEQVLSVDYRMSGVRQMETHLWHLNLRDNFCEDMKNVSASCMINCNNLTTLMHIMNTN